MVNCNTPLSWYCNLCFQVSSSLLAMSPSTNSCLYYAWFFIFVSNNFIIDLSIKKLQFCMLSGTWSWGSNDTTNESPQWCHLCWRYSITTIMTAELHLVTTETVMEATMVTTVAEILPPPRRKQWSCYHHHHNLILGVPTPKPVQVPARTLWPGGTTVIRRKCGGIKEEWCCSRWISGVVQGGKKWWWQQGGKLVQDRPPFPFAVAGFPSRAGRRQKQHWQSQKLIKGRKKYGRWKKYLPIPAEAVAVAAVGLNGKWFVVFLLHCIIHKRH